MGGLNTEIESFFNELKSLAQLIAPIIAFLGFVGLGVMYMGSSIPVISDWKKGNPQASSQVMMGLVFMLIASSMASVVSFT